MQERQSNIELLRIIATLMILVVHYSDWLITVGGTSLRSAGIAMYVTCGALYSLSCIGVILFVLISGYFSIKPKVRSLLNLFTCLAFFYTGSYLLNGWAIGEAISLHGILKSVMAFSYENWFIQSYLFLILLSPMLNAFVEKVSERELFVYILLFVGCAFYFGCVHDSTYFYFNRGYSVTTLMMIYLIGRYIRLYGEKRLQKVESWKVLVIWALCTFSICACKVLVPRYGVYTSYHSPLAILSAVSFFMLFTRIHIQSKVINWISISCLASFILHTQKPVINWMSRADVRLFNTGNILYYIGGCVCICLTIFIVSVLLDKVRLFICNPLLKLADNRSKVKKGSEKQQL